MVARGRVVALCGGPKTEEVLVLWVEEGPDAAAVDFLTVLHQ